ncbi:protein FAF-like, chloroplastic [Sesbania bispinosa]|nr:protein FAF-like, chloroplastic [Sesbania bispinosa]
MATCGSLQHIFDSLLPENPTLLESLSWNQVKPVKSIEQSPSFTEIFGELHFNETSVSDTSITTNYTNRHKSSDSFSSLNSESLQLCTEGLGFESSDDVEDLKNGVSECWQTHGEKEGVKKHFSSEDSYGECRRSTRVSAGEYPPPISCIGRLGSLGFSSGPIEVMGDLSSKR